MGRTICLRELLLGTEGTALFRHLIDCDQEFAQATPVNAIAVLSRADEVGVGRLDSMSSASRIANRYKHDVKVRRLCQTVVPVAGLLAQSGSTLG